MFYKKLSAFIIALISLSFTSTSQEVTHDDVAKNFFIDVAGTYPTGYEPKWKYVGTRESLDFEREDFLAAKPRVTADPLFISLGEAYGKMAFSFSAFIDCDCIADFSIPEGTKFTLSATPHKFKLINFRKITDGTPCASAHNMYFAAYDGSITLSARTNGDMLMDLTLQSYRRPDRFGNNGVSYIWRANNVQIPNLVTPEKARSTIAQKEKEKQDEIAYKKKKEAQSKQREAMDAEYKKMLVKIKALPEANPKTLLTYKGYVLKTVLNINKLIGKHSCNESITSEGTSMRKIFELSNNNRWAMTRIYLDFTPSTVELHKRDARFAYVYLATRRYNELAAQMAARYMLCDMDEVSSIEHMMADEDNLVDAHEWNEMVKYLENKK